MLGDIFGGPDDEPDLVVERDPDAGRWRATGAAAHGLDNARTLAGLLEILVQRHSASTLVEVRAGSGPWTATVAQLARDYGRDYRDPSPVDPYEAGPDPFFDHH